MIEKDFNNLFYTINSKRDLLKTRAETDDFSAGELYAYNTVIEMLTMYSQAGNVIRETKGDQNGN